MKIYLDSADLDEMRRFYPEVDGFTTNPSLMRKAGVVSYRNFVQEALGALPDKPISFEVIADDIPSMVRQATWLSAQGQHVLVKIPIMTTWRESTIPLIRELAAIGIKVNVTAVMTYTQIKEAVLARPAIVSIFVGRIKDAGYYPPVIGAGRHDIPEEVKFLWASTRELFDIKDAESNGYDIITMTPELLEKRKLIGKDLNDYSRETVQMFYNDAVESGYTL